MSVTGNRPSFPNDRDRFDPAGGMAGDFADFPSSPAEALEPSRPPEPPDFDEDRRMHPVLAFFNAMFMLTFAAAVLALAAYFWLRVQFDRPGPLPTSTVVVIPKGEGVDGIAERLKHDEVIDDRGLFRAFVIYFSYLRGTGSMKAGEYEFRKHASLRQVLDTLVEGRSIEHKVTLAEGLTSQQMIDRLRANPDLTGEVATTPAEGSLLPDTYQFDIGDTRADIVERMQAAQKKFTAKMWEERDPDIFVQTLDEAIVLASIVEKETSRADERPRIASVFENRLRKKMRLQSDPTIIYGLVGGKGVLDGPITQDQLDRETPYNTYKINGLPPTPIANPGRAAIEAVMKPAKTSDLYFVADGTGGHAFAPSLDEHNKNVTRWRQVERAKREKERAEAEAAAAAGAAAPGAATAPWAVAPGAGAAPGAATPGAAPGEAVDGSLTTAASANAETPPAAAAAAPPVPQGPPPPLPKRNPKR